MTLKEKFYDIGQKSVVGLATSGAILVLGGSVMKGVGAHYASQPDNTPVERIEPWDTIDDAIGGWRYESNNAFGRFMIRGIETQVAGGGAILLASILAQYGFRRRAEEYAQNMPSDAKQLQ